MSEATRWRCANGGRSDGECRKKEVRSEETEGKEKKDVGNNDENKGASLNETCQGKGNGGLIEVKDRVAVDA